MMGFVVAAISYEMVDDLVFDTLSYKRDSHYTHILVIRGSDILIESAYNCRSSLPCASI